MADPLGRLKGQFVLSINDVPETRETFAVFDIEPVDLQYGVGGGSAAAKELIVSGP